MPSRLLSTVSGLILFGLALSGCAGGPDTAALPDTQPTQASAAAAAPADPSAAEAETVATPVEPPEKPLPALDVLFGAAPQKLVALLGEPALKRLDPPAELWQYKAKGCVLALYLYADGKAAKAAGMPVGAMAKVTHVEARDLDAKRVETATCFHALLRERS